MKTEDLYLSHIVDASVLVDKYIAHGKDAFLTDDMIQNAIIKVVGNIAESASKLSTETKEEYADIPWQTVKAFRNVLVHDYLGDLDCEELWQIINHDLPTLVNVAKKILKDKYNG